MENILAASSSVDHLHTPRPSVSLPRVAQAPPSRKPNTHWRRRAVLCSVLFYTSEKTSSTTETRALFLQRAKRSIFDFVGHVVSVTATQLCCCSTKAVINDTQKDRVGCVPLKLFFSLCGIELMTLRWRVAHSTDCASQPGTPPVKLNLSK